MLNRNSFSFIRDALVASRRHIHLEGSDASDVLDLLDAAIEEIDLIEQEMLSE